MTKKIIFLHPDLGVGGAERLVVDAAIVLQEKGYDVSFVTSYHNKNHCFDETKNGMVDVKVIGEWIPRNIFGRFFALFAYLKMIYCALYIVFFEKADLVFCDLVSVCIPILHIGVKKVIFYCHYPDQLLSKEEGLLKRLYRFPLNWLEEKTTNCADKIYVNSEFTKSVFKNTFKSVSKIPTVLYPSINTKPFDNIENGDVSKFLDRDKEHFVFMSINRFERKKNIELSIFALNVLKKKVNKDDWAKILLLITGGYDPRIDENVEYCNELNSLVDELELNDKIVFIKSPSDNEKLKLLKLCNCLIYTPPNEHFGIVPLEAMYFKKPVIACNSGGPKETVLNGTTGILCEMNAQEFAEAMLQFIENKNLAIDMGNEGYKRFIEKFREAFSEQLSQDVHQLLNDDDKNN